MFTLAAVAALLSSGWNNRQLLQRVGVDIARYERIAMDDYRPKASAVRVLREDAALLDSWARNGVPLRLSLGLYRGGADSPAAAGGDSRLRAAATAAQAGAARRAGRHPP